MCVRTKNSYGCGHTYKQDQRCNYPSCSRLERFHFKREGDCRDCRHGGEAISRGREGQGRYARELSRRDDRPFETRVPLAPITTNGKTSPWALASRKDKKWEKSPIRRKADEAWESEHTQRQEDLHSRSHLSKSGGSVRSQPQSPCGRRGRDDSEDAIRQELRKVEDSERVRIRRRQDRLARHDSLDSFDESYGSHGSSGLYSRGRSTARRSQESGGPPTGLEQYDSGFGGVSSRIGRGSPYNVYNTESYIRGLGQGLGHRVRDSSWRWPKW